LCGIVWNEEKPNLPVTALVHNTVVPWSDHMGNRAEAEYNHANGGI